MTTLTYKQIVPADGWVAVFSRNKPDEQGRHFFIDPLAVWVLVEVERNRAAFVGGLCGSHMNEEPWLFGNFLCYARRDEIEAAPDRFNDWAKRAVEGQQETEKAWNA